LDRRLTQTPYKSEMKSFLKYWLPVLIWLCLIFVGSTGVLSAEQTSRFLVPFLRWLKPEISLAAITAIQLGIRKVGHLTEYAILSALLWRAMRSTVISTKAVAIAGLALVMSAIFAASDEFHQSFVPSRTATLGDVMIDICGALVGLMICWLFASRRNLQNI
jgi:VanZ family protein